VGIDTRAARHAALLQLAGEIPGAVLVDTLTVDVGTATRWTDRAVATWNSDAGKRLPSRIPAKAQSH